VKKPPPSTPLAERAPKRRFQKTFTRPEPPERPDWMTDRSKLPKAPPGREGRRPSH
jgi:hypothetical protein